MRQTVSPPVQSKSVADLLLMAVEAEEMRRSLKKFVIGAWKYVDPAPYTDGWCVDAICAHLTALTLGQMRFLLINIPPRHSKSTICSVIWPVWAWLQNPSERFMSASYSLDLSARDSAKKRTLMESSWFKERYGQDFKLTTDSQAYEFIRESDFELSREQNSKRFSMNNKLGYLLSTAVQAGVTGHGGSILIIDDAHAANEAHSEVKREGANTWFRETWSNRMNDANKDKMLVIGQRIHEDDVSGIILRERPDWVHLNLPAEYEPARHCRTYIVPAIPTRARTKVESFADPDKSYDVAFLEGKAVSCSCEAFIYHPEKPCKHMQSAKCPAPEKELFWEDPRKEEGELLWPERFSEETLNRYKRDLGSMGYSAQYQQSPIPASGGIFKEQNERLFAQSYDTYFLHTPKGIRSVAKSACTKFITVDPAISEKQSADYTVIGTWAKTPFKDLLLLNIRRGHWSHREQQEEIKEEFQESGAEFVAVETVAYQAALFQDLLEEGIFCKPYVAKTDKVLRASGAGIWHENGKYYFLVDAEWLEAYKKELYKFPKAPKDDQADMTSLSGIVIRSRGPLSDDNLDMEVPDPIEGPPDPEQKSIPLTTVIVPVENPPEETVYAVTPQPNQIDAFAWAERHGYYGGDW